MATNARFLYVDYVATAPTITVTNTASGFSVDYLRTNSLLVPHRTTTDASITYGFDFGSAVSIGAVGVAGHNITSAATMVFQRSSDNAAWFDFCDPAWGEKLIFGSATAHGTYRYWRLIIADAANPDTYQEVGRIMIGPYFQPVDNFEPPYTRPEEALSIRQQALNGAENYVVRPSRSGRGLRFPISTTAELNLWRTFQKTVSIHKPFAVGLDTDNYDDLESMMARCRAEIDLPNVFGPTVNEAIIDCREVIG